MTRVRRIYGACCCGSVWRTSMQSPISMPRRESIVGADKSASPLAGMVDCMIAAVAYRRVLALLAWDADMFRVAQVIGIELDQASLRA